MELYCYAVWLWQWSVLLRCGNTWVINIRFHDLVKPVTSAAVSIDLQTPKRRQQRKSRKQAPPAPMRELSGRVLVVDDSALNRKMIISTIKGHVSHVSQAENGAEAVTVYEEAVDNGDSFDIILMDSIMPIMNGIDATKRLRADGYSGLIFGVSKYYSGVLLFSHEL